MKCFVVNKNICLLTIFHVLPLNIFVSLIFWKAFFAVFEFVGFIRGPSNISLVNIDFCSKVWCAFVISAFMELECVIENAFCN